MDQEPALVSPIEESFKRSDAMIPMICTRCFTPVQPLATSEEPSKTSLISFVFWLFFLRLGLGRVVRGRCAPVLAWLGEYASVLWNRYVSSVDGNTAYGRIGGHRYCILGIGFAEKVHWIRSKRGTQGVCFSVAGRRYVHISATVLLVARVSMATTTESTRRIPWQDVCRRALATRSRRISRWASLECERFCGSN